VNIGEVLHREFEIESRIESRSRRNRPPDLTREGGANAHSWGISYSGRTFTNQTDDLICLAIRNAALADMTPSAYSVQASPLFALTQIIINYIFDLKAATALPI
jgi:hypothetical protein